MRANHCHAVPLKTIYNLFNLNMILNFSLGPGQKLKLLKKNRHKLHNVATLMQGAVPKSAGTAVAELVYS
jgi:hypothetical protein